MESDAVVFYIELFIPIFSLLFCVPLYLRKQCLKTIAQQNLQSYSKKYKNYRIVLQIFNILAYTNLVVLQLCSIPILMMDNESYQYIYPIIWVFPIVVGAIQIYIEDKEFHSKIPLMIYHKIYWIGQMVISFIIVVYLFITKDKQDTDELIRLFSFTGRAVIQMIIAVYIFIKKQDIQEFMDLRFLIWDLEVNQIQTPLIKPANDEMVFDNNSDQGPSDNEIDVIVLPGFVTQHSSLQFKLRVILNPRRTVSGSNNMNQLYGITNSQKEYTITKEYSEFIQLQEDLNEEIRNDEAVTDSTIEDMNNINLLCTNNISLEYSQVESLSNKLKEFMKFVCKNPNIYYSCFLKFIKISEMDLKQYYLELKNNNPKRQDYQRQNQRLESANNQSQSFNIDYKNQEYFEVIFDKSEEKNIDHVKYQIKITNLSNKCYVKLQMRYSELRQMHQALKQHFKNMPKFPSKIIKTNSSALQDRMIQLQLYLCILLNEDEYHRESILSNQLNPYITKQFGSKLWHTGTVNLYRCNYYQWRAESCGSFIQMTDKESKGFTVYRFTVFENESRRGQIEKRFKEFVKLHEFVEHKFSHIVDSLPSLPPKISNFNTNIPKEKRQLDLQEYMNKLFRINNIDSCYFFRQFFSIVSQPLELLNMSQSPQLQPQEILNNPEQTSELMDDVLNLRDQMDTSNQAENHLNSLQIDELQQYAGQISPSTN
ncbi:PX domain protein (macronuclear) [Tetrahymena thermophila SB210]|uniref:PX domain protein n=1 Tax=Tetrahymena thermophila (strain SB210) TaxID=312017 RepID=Q23VB5_TETTS|nr:PX domain protein [Tetrahymena thermophila SB210]EAS00467.2 PX domain protein [Tetrahymena thermophila SB210]|eukprot:XP_001020712.2 PX domain protein [Tetrahymena thermophila SB210]